MKQSSQQMAMILYGSMVSSVVMFACALVVILANAEIEPAAEEALIQPLMEPFAMLAVALAFAAFWVPSMILKAAVKKAPKENGQLNLSDEDCYRLALNPLLIGLALAEGLAVLGFILGKIGETVSGAAPFFAVSLIIMFFKFPSPSRIRAQITKAASSS